jgi:hypothetical protein
MPSNPVTGKARGRFPSPTFEEQRDAMTRLGATHCPRCANLGQIKVAVGWRPNPRDQVGYLPPVIEYAQRACPRCCPAPEGESR